MKLVAVEEAVGMVLCQDVTKIEPGRFKGRAFKKGHVIREEDVRELLSLGKEHIYVWEPGPGDVHEDEAAVRIAGAVAGPNITWEEPVEGKSLLRATVKGLFRVDTDLLFEINSIEAISVACLPDNFRVEQGQGVAGARVIPLVIPGEKLEQVERLCSKRGPALQVVEYRRLRYAVVVTGNEVFKGRIEDRFGPVIRSKMEYFGADCLGHTLCPDDTDAIAETVLAYAARGAELILLTGGMSVDPDDRTPGAIRKTGAGIVVYGAPVQPGNMFLLAYLKNTVLIGVPGCAMFFKTTILDAVLPRIMAGEVLTRNDFVKMGAGGFCLSCEECRYPQCYFCRGA